MEAMWSTVQSYATTYGFKVLGAVAILIIGRIIAGWLAKLVGRLLDKREVDQTLTRFLVSLTRIGLLTFVTLAALSTLGIQTASFVAVIGAAGLAIGFALQGSLSNFAAGIMLISFRPFKAGDFVEAGGVSGSVDSVQLFVTIMRTPDNKRVIIPNNQITSGSITNFSAEENRRVDLVFGIGYGDDLKKAKEILERLVSEDNRILKDPAPNIKVGELADSSVNLLCRPWVKSGDYWGVYWDLTEKVKLTFDAEGISIPFPQQDVYMHQVTAA